MGNAGGVFRRHLFSIKMLDWKKFHLRNLYGICITGLNSLVILVIEDNTILAASLQASSINTRLLLTGMMFWVVKIYKSEEGYNGVLSSRSIWSIGKR